MKLGLGVKFSTSLSLTPQLQQAIRLLQLSTQELELEIQTQLESNPLLESVGEESMEGHSTATANNADEVTYSDASYSDARYDTAEYSLNKEDRYNKESNDKNSVVELEDAFRPLNDCLNQNTLSNDLPVDTNWDDVYAPNATSALGSSANIDSEDYSSVTPICSLSEHLQQQLQYSKFSAIDSLIASCLIDDLDSRGYLQSSIEHIRDTVQTEMDVLCDHLSSSQSKVFSEWLEIESDQIVAVLHALQNFEPTGVFARDLVECLILQLKQGQFSSTLKQDTLTVLQHPALLLAQDKAKIIKATGLSETALKNALACLKGLDPAPGIAFSNQQDVYQTPDAIVQRKADRWSVSLNVDHLPKLRVNPYYAGQIKRADDSASNQYLRQHMLEAKHFIKGIEERHKTLLKVASCIVKYQQDFLSRGSEYMRPLVLREVAEEVELHESTVSRVTTQKYILTPQGLYELKFFFSSHVGTAEGGACSSTAIRAKLKKLIKEENPKKPLSDQALSDLFKVDGIDVARRTIAKYRESLNIPSSSERKHLL